MVERDHGPGRESSGPATVYQASAMADGVKPGVAPRIDALIPKIAYAGIRVGWTIYNSL